MIPTRTLDLCGRVAILLFVVVVLYGCGGGDEPEAEAPYHPGEVWLKSEALYDAYHACKLPFSRGGAAKPTELLYTYFPNTQDAYDIGWRAVCKDGSTFERLPKVFPQPL